MEQAQLGQPSTIGVQEKIQGTPGGAVKGVAEGCSSES